MNTTPCMCCGKKLEEFEQLELSGYVFCGIRCHKKFLYAQPIADCFICHEKVFSCQPRANVDKGAKNKWVHLSEDDEYNCYLKWRN